MSKRLPIAPTKSNQLALRRDLTTVKEGFSLLDQKKSIIALELVKLLVRVQRVETVREEVEKRAFTSLRRALLIHGHLALQEMASRVRFDHDVEVTSRVVAGVRVPVMCARSAPFTLRVSGWLVDSTIDESVEAFRELLLVMVELSELETAVTLLAHELRKTKRRVSALEHEFIPQFEDTLHYVTEVLEERELENFYILKRIKSRLDHTVLD